MLWSWVAAAQVVTIDVSPAGNHQVMDGFGTCLSGSEGQQLWWQQLCFDDLGVSMIRVDLSPSFGSPYSDNAYNSPTWGAPGPDGYYARDYTNAHDYQRVFSGRSAPIAVMGPNIDTNIGYFVFPPGTGRGRPSRDHAPLAVGRFQTLRFYVFAGALVESLFGQHV